jgi:hypothetical protein
MSCGSNSARVFFRGARGPGEGVDYMCTVRAVLVLVPTILRLQQNWRLLPSYNVLNGLQEENIEDLYVYSVFPRQEYAQLG